MIAVAAGTVIRAATSADIPAIVQMGLSFLRESSYRDLFPENPAQIAALAERLIERPDGIVLLAEIEDTPIGLIALTAYPHFISGERVVGEVVYWVAPHARTAGLRLFREAEAWARAQGAVVLMMISPSDRTDRLYARLGYVPVERTFQRRLA